MSHLQRVFLGSHKCDWRAGREAEFVRSAAMLLSFPHWGLGEGEVPAVLQQAIKEADALTGNTEDHCGAV